MRVFQILATVMVLASPAMAADPVATITVTGEGRVDTAPDMATISIGVTTEGDTAKGAMDANTARSGCCHRAT